MDDEILYRYLVMPIVFTTYLALAIGSLMLNFLFGIIVLWLLLVIALSLQPHQFH